MKRPNLKKIYGTIMSFGLLLATLTVPMETVHGAEATETITVSSNVSTEQMQSYIDAFEEEYPNIKVQYRYASDYESQIAEDIENDNLSDVLFVPGYFSEGDYTTYLMSLGNYSDFSNKYNYMQGGKYINEKVYGLPSSAYISGFVYNTEVFQKAGISTLPTSIEEFVEDLRMISSRTDAIPFYSNESTSWALRYWEIFPFLETTGNPDYLHDEFIYERYPFTEESTHGQVYGLLYEIVSQGLCETEEDGIDWEKSKSMLANGEIGCVAIGSWALSQFRDVAEDSNSIAFMSFPYSVDGEQYATISTDYCYAISKDTAHEDAAMSYITFMIEQSGYALDHNNISIVKTDPYPEGYSELSDVNLMMTNPASSDQIQNWYNSLSANLNFDDGSEIQRVIKAARDGEETLQKILDDWNIRWEENRPENMPLSGDGEEKEKLLEELTLENEEVTLSESELEYIATSGIVSVGYMNHMAPFSYEKDGEMAGFERSLLDMISEESGLRFTYHPYDNYQELVAAVDRGEIQMIAGMDAALASESIRTSKTYLDYIVAIVKSDATSLNDLENKTIASVLGEDATVSLMNLVTSEESSYETLSMALQAVNQGDADYVVSNYYSADYYIKDLELEHVSVIPLSRNSNLAFGFSKNVNSLLVSICNKYLYSIPDNILRTLLTEEMDPPAKEITLGRLIQQNPIQSIFIITALLVIIGVTFYMIRRRQWMNERRHIVDVRRYEVLESMMDEYVFEVDFDKREYHFGEKFGPTFGIPAEIKLDGNEFQNDCLNAIIDISKQGTTKDQFESEPFSVVLDDGIHFYQMNLYALEDMDGNKAHSIGKITNVDKAIQKEREAEERAVRDPLTGLYNRAGFVREISSIEHAVESACFMISDLDNFKSVNDHLGHAGGDEALKIFAKTLAEVFADGCIVSRFGGDEFVVYLYGYEMPEAQKLLEKIVQEMNQDMEFDGEVHHLSISVGAIYTKQKLDQSELLKLADEQLYISKENGKNQFTIREYE